MLILDEADEMLNKGFKEQIYDVYRYLPPSTQVCLISATLPHEILEMTSKFMSDPIRILVKRDELTLEGKLKMKFEQILTVLNGFFSFQFQESSNFSSPSKEKNGNSTHSATCTTP